jgi:hypothetical protein
VSSWAEQLPYKSIGKVHNSLFGFKKVPDPNGKSSGSEWEKSWIRWEKFRIRLGKVPDPSGKNSGSKWEKFRIRVRKIPDPRREKFRIRNAQERAHPYLISQPVGRGSSWSWPWVRGSSHWVVLFLWFTKYTRPFGSTRFSQPSGSGPAVFQALVTVNLSTLCCGSGFSAGSGSTTRSDPFFDIPVHFFARASVTENKKRMFKNPINQRLAKEFYFIITRRLDTTHWS